MSVPKPTVIEFSLRSPYPKLHKGEKVGPSLIRRALKGGYYVLATVIGTPMEVAVQDARWYSGILEVRVMEGWRAPQTLRTVHPRNMKGIKL